MDLPSTLIPNSRYTPFRWFSGSAALVINQRLACRGAGVELIRMFPGNAVMPAAEEYSSSVSRVAVFSSWESSGDLLLVSRGQGSFLSLFGNIIHHSLGYLSTRMSSQGISPSNLPQLYSFVKLLLSVVLHRRLRLEDTVAVLDHLLLPGISILDWLASDFGHTVLEKEVVPLVRQQYRPDADEEILHAYMLAYSTPQVRILGPCSKVCTPLSSLRCSGIPWDPVAQRLLHPGGSVLYLVLSLCGLSELEVASVAEMEHCLAILATSSWPVAAGRHCPCVAIP